MTVVVIAAFALAMASDDGEAPSEASRPVVAVEVDPAAVCDAGDEAFIKRIVPILWGRRPVSIREVDVLLQVLRRTDRATLVRAMSRSDEFATRQWSLFKDGLEVNRAGPRAPPACYGAPMRTETGTELATWVRDHAPESAPPITDWNLTDLFRSALQLDDVSVVLKAHLVMIPATPVAPTEDAEQRSVWSQTFQRTYLNRSQECMVCHNSEYNVLFDPDPRYSRAWSVPGHFEKALYGNSGGPGPTGTAVHTLFRQGGVLVPVDGGRHGPPRPAVPSFQPWGASAQCGTFVRPEAIGPNGSKEVGFFIESTGTVGSVFDLQRHLSAGLAKLRLAPLVLGPELSMDPEVGFAYLTSLSIANMVWREVTGRSLTTANHFPRNRFQRDLMVDLAERFIGSGFSLRELLVAIVTHPTYNQANPPACDAPGSPYHLPPIFDPWTVSDELPERRRNGVGDALRPLDPRLAYGAVAYALGWPAPREFITEKEPDAATVQLPIEGRFQRDIGVYLTDSERGFRGASLLSMLSWEAGVGACVDPMEFASSTYWLDPRPDDFIDRLVRSAGPDTRLEDIIGALQDRLISDPKVESPAVRAAFERLFGASLGTPVAEVVGLEGNLRLACGVILGSPQFLMAGDPGPDRVGSTMPIIVEGTSFLSLCQRLAPVLFPDGHMRCSESGVELKDP